MKKITLLLFSLLFNHYVNAGDSLWCVNLLEVIKVVSTDNITLPVADFENQKEVVKTIPLLHLFPGKVETVEKKYNKVTYEAIVYISAKQNYSLQHRYEQLLSTTKKCLYEWTLDTLSMTDSSIAIKKQYMFTNSEDETNVRIDIIRLNKMYAIRFRVL